MRPSLLLALLVILSGGFGTAVQAEQFKPFDQYEVHYSAFNSSFVPPDVALAYELKRSRNRALMNIAVLKKVDGKKPSVAAQVNGSMKNLVGQHQDLEFTEIREGESIYYIASFRFTDDEVLSFDIDVKPEAGAASYKLNFKQHFYAD